MKYTKTNKITGPIIITALIVITFLSVAIINSMLTSSLFDSDTNYVKSIIKEPTQNVYSEINNEQEVIETDVIMEPYISDDVEITVNYYNKDDSESLQEASIIKYENTYIPSSGLLYSSENSFNVVAIYDGQVIDIKEDNLLGKNITIKHSDGLTGYYYSIDNINLEVGDIVMQGQVLGTSSKNKISPSDNNLLFEVSYEDKLINPEEIYNKNIGNFS